MRRQPKTMKPAIGLLTLCLALSACTAPAPPPAAVDAQQQRAAEQLAADVRARYDADLRACRDRAQQMGVLRETLDAVVEGALMAAILAWWLGRSDTGVRDWAAVGGAVVGGSRGLQALERRQRWVAQCMAAQGHHTGPFTTATPTMPGPGLPAAPPRPTGADAYSAERLARQLACHAQPVATLTAKGPGFESYTVPCSNGDALALRCEFGNCRVLR